MLNGTGLHEDPWVQQMSVLGNIFNVRKEEWSKRSPKWWEKVKMSLGSGMGDDLWKLYYGSRAEECGGMCGNKMTRGITRGTRVRAKLSYQQS